MMHLRKAALGGICLLGLAVSPAEAQDCHVALFGHVRDADTGQPIAYATIQVPEAGKQTLSDETGYYLISDLCEGVSYTVSVDHVECEHETRLVRLVENQAVDFALHHRVLREITVSARATAPPPAQAAARVARADLEAAKGVNLAETLKSLPGVASLNTGASIAKPVIHGLHSNRIAIVTNQVALEGQQWGSEHAPEVDPFTADQVTVVKGAAAVRYGTGALGGAVVLEPAPLRDRPGMGGWATLGLWSNGIGGLVAGALDHRLAHKPLAYRVQLTAKRNGNLRAPGYWLGNTGATELNGALLAAWDGPRWRHELGFTRFQQRLGVLRAAHIGNTTDLLNAINSERPLNNPDTFTWNIDRPYQNIQHNLLKYKTQYRLTEKWRLGAQYAFQFNHRREYDVLRSASDPSDKPQLAFRIWTNTLDASIEHLPIRHWQGGVGVQGFQQLNYVSRGGLIPNYLTLGGSLWLLERWRRYPHPWEYEFGLRYDYRWSHVTDEGNLPALDTIVRFGNVSATGGIVYRIRRNLSLTLNTAFAWRPPHVNELFAQGVHHGAATFEQGRSDLRSEKAWNTNLSLNWQNKKGAEAALTLYRNQIEDFIYLDPRREVVLTVRGAFPLHRYEQADAVLQGMDASLSLPLSRRWSAETRASLLRGRRQGVDSSRAELPPRRDWLPLMPPDRFQYGLRWRLQPERENSAFVRLLATTALRQTRIPAAGLLKAAPPAFTVLGLDVFYPVKMKKYALEIGLNAQNLTNQRYREYLNFFRLFSDEPGTNVSARVKLIF